MAASSKIYDKQNNFNFKINNFPFLDEDVPSSPSLGIYILQLVRFARVCFNVDTLNSRNECLASKILQQGYGYHKLRKAFSELNVKYNICLKTLLQQGKSEPVFYVDLDYEFEIIV